MVEYISRCPSPPTPTSPSRRCSPAGRWPTRSSAGSPPTASTTCGWPTASSSSTSSPGRAIGELAARLGVSQQAASKSVADLERRGYVRREADPADGRARHAALTARGEAAIAAGRRHRAAVAAELASAGRGARGGRARTLVDVLEALGGGAAVRGRRVRPPA